MRKLIFKTNFALGDIVLLTAAVRDLHRCYPGAFITDVRTPCGEMWNHNPYLRHLSEDDPEVETFNCDLSLIDWANKVPYHALDGFIDNLNEQLGLHIRCTEFKGDIHLSNAEKRGRSSVHELAGCEIPFWIIFAGGRHEITIKWWDSDRYQEVVDHFKGRIQFVQAGSASDHHPKLNGTIDLRGQTRVRQLLQLFYHAQGVLCGVTGPMHLAAAVEMKTPSARLRPCVVVAGGREPVHWEAYPGHQFIHTVGALPCCANGGCWKTRTATLGDGSSKDKPDQLCLDVKGELPHCMDLISSVEVVRRIETYFLGGSLKYLTPAQAKAGRKAVERTAENPIDRRPLTLPNARYASARFIHSIAPCPKNFTGRGILICAGGVAHLTSAWVCIKMLRRLGCRLPVELWHWGRQEMDPEMKRLLRPLNVQCIDALEVRNKHPTRITRGPQLKPYAVSYCSFKEVLLLEANTVPVANPESLFATPEFRRHGAMFWPAAPRRQIEPQAWQLCGMASCGESPIGTDHMLMDKEKCWKALLLWLWYHENCEVYDALTHDGSDAAHLAFRKLEVPFVMPSRIHRPGVFQYDLAGRPVFQHRKNDPWSLFFTHQPIRGFRFEHDCRKYVEELRRCWGAPSIQRTRFSLVQPPNKAERPGKVIESSPQVTGTTNTVPQSTDERHSTSNSQPPTSKPVRRVGIGSSMSSSETSSSHLEAFTVLTLHDERMAGVGTISSQALRDYARCQNYGFVYHDQLIDPTRHPSWNKILAVRNALLKQKEGWVMWVDADALVMNHRVRAETLIPQGHDLVFASDDNGLVAGIFLIRYCEWSLKFLETVFFLGDLNYDPDGFGPKWEQNTIKHILKNFAGFAEHAALLPKRRLNSDLASFQPGDFILHVGLMTNGNRERTLREALRWIVK